MQISFERLAAAVLVTLLATTASASDAPLECTTGGAGNWKITVTGPVSVACSGAGDCTRLGYDVAALKGLQPDHVAILAEHDMDIVAPEARNVSAPCVGDSVTLLGTRDCSTKAVRMNKNADTGFFELIVEGVKDLTGSSIVVKKGKVIEQCRIASLGTENFDVNAQRTANQEIVFKGCTVSIPTDPVTGEGGAATISGPNCVFVANGEPVEVAELVVAGKNVGNVTFGEGFVSSGASSCTTKVINRRLYTWCTCEDVNGDGVPDDPIPPCPLTVP